jgi:hypothetical protein
LEAAKVVEPKENKVTFARYWYSKNVKLSHHAMNTYARVEIGTK